MAILAGLLGVLIVFFSLMYALFRDEYRQHFSTPKAFVHIFLIIASLLCYELAIRQLIGRWLRQGKAVPSALRYLNAFVETSVPSIIILLVARETNPVHVLQSAAALLYAVFIALYGVVSNNVLEEPHGMFLLAFLAAAGFHATQRSRDVPRAWAPG